MTTADITVQHAVALSPAQISDVLQLINATAQADGTMPISEHVLLHLRQGGDAHGQHLLARDSDDHLVGYAHLDVTDTVQGASAEILVEPQRRREGVGRTMITALDDLVAGSRLRLWAHGEQPGARELAESLGFRSVRVLWQMRRSLLAALPRPVIPPGIEIRSFDPAADCDAWVALNARAFSNHPEQGGWTRADLDLRMSEPWFDPAGFLLATQVETGALVGFHWTKVHGFDPAEGHTHAHGHVQAHHSTHAASHTHAHEPIGEVYVVGVSPDYRGSGLGRALTILGLEHLRHLGLAQAMLYVDAGNTRAIRLYEGLGFARWDTDVMYQRQASANVR
ncbi:MAG: mycothiol synthase [Actinomycetales bacterium]|nr:mycothiol synthase [Actinomycetales bacterium]